MTSEDIRADYVWRTMEAMGTIWSDDHCGHVTRQMADEIVRLRLERDELASELSISRLAHEEQDKRFAAVEAERDAMEGMYRHHVGVALDAIAKLNHTQATVSTLQEQLTHQTYTLTAEHQRAERTLAALREPSEAVVKAVKDAIYEELGIEYLDGKTRRILYYAVAAAEKEVSDA